jgi:hypothetical protein
MKRKNLNKLALVLASASVATAFGGLMLSNSVSVAADEPVKYEISKIFAGSNAVLDAQDNTTAFSVSNGGSVRFKSNLAYKWQSAKDQSEYLNLTFAFKDTNFTTVSFDFETNSAWATKDNKTTNTVEFKKGETNYIVAINGKDVMTVAAADINKDMKISLSESATAKDGEFIVNLKVGDVAATVTDAENCKFVNVGAYYSSYSFDKMNPLSIKATLPADADADHDETVILLKNINGQAFNALGSDKRIVDDTAPVMVVNEEIDGFLLGSTFSLDYTVVDVLKKDIASADKKLTYYQYNPNNLDGVKSEDYKTLDSSVYFMDTVYTNTATNEQTTVFKELGAEYVSVKSSVSDGTNTAEVDLSWYAKTTREIDSVVYIPVDKNADGAKYTFVTANTSTSKNDFDESVYTNSDAYKYFVNALNEEAASKSAGSNATLNIPSLKWFINDNNGYRNLKFTISYKTPTSDTASTSSNLSYQSLKLSVAEEGTYQFKIFATDKLGNPMKYYDEDGVLVDVAAANIWDIEQIPYFTFTINNQGLSIDSAKDTASNRKTSVLLNKTYTFADIQVTGADSIQEKYALYRVDFNKYNATAESGKKLTQSVLSSVAFAEINNEIEKYKNSSNANYTAYQTAVATGNYFDLYLTAYAKLLAVQIGVSTTNTEEIAKIKSCFVAINEYDSRITEENAPTEWNAYNKYKWQPKSQSFYTKEEGSYIVVADYYEKLLPSVRISAYKVVNVESEADVIKGESEWLKNNVTSVVMFSIAGVMFIFIIILLLVKPSDETLEDVDKKAKKQAKKEKKAKKSKKD